MESLPSEILSQIFDYLSFEDRQQMTLVNTEWHYAAMHPQFLKKELFVFDEYAKNKPYSVSKDRFNSPNYEHFKETLLKSKRGLVNLSLQFRRETDLEDLTIFLNLGVHIKYLCLGHLNRLSDVFLDSITTYCTNLESLVFMDVGLSITEKPRVQLLNMNYLTFNKVGLTDMSFNIIMKCFPNLKDIYIASCQMLVWPQIINRFYPNYRDQATLTNYSSDYVFTDVNFLRFFTTAKSIISLRLETYSHILLHLPKNIKLDYLVLESILMNDQSVDQKIDINKYISVLSKQTSLQRLKIFCCFCCSLLSVIPKLKNLRRLTIHFSSIPHYDCRVNDVTAVQNFFSSLNCNKHISSFKIFAPRNYSSNAFEIPDCFLKSLKTLNCPISNIMQLINLGKNLTSLEIPNGEILTADNLKLLFKTLTNLRKLVINKCEELNDNILLESPISNLKGLVYLGITGGNLTYKCFPFIQLKDLKFLRIHSLSLGQCIDKMDMTDFKNCLNKFGCYVPALISLEIKFKPENYHNANIKGFDLIHYFTDKYELDNLISNFKILKYCNIIPFSS